MKTEARYRATWLALIPAIFFLYACLQTYLGEKIPFNDGLGFDGILYARYAKLSFAHFVSLFKVSNYLVWRFIPSLVASGLMAAGAFSRDTVGAIEAFKAINLAASAVSLICFHRLARALRWEASLYTLAFFAIFVNYENARLVYYYPVLTDAVALAVSLGSLQAYVRGKRVQLLAWSFLALGCWPTAIITNSLLLCFPWREPFELFRAPRTLFSRGVGYLFGAAVLFVALYYKDLPQFGNREAAVYRPLFYVSLTCSLLYSWFGFQPLLAIRYGDFFLRLRQKSWLIPGACVLALVLGRAFTTHLFSDGTSGQTPIRYFASVAALSVNKPAVFLLGQLIYFGPLFTLFLLRWEAMVAQSLKLNPAIWLVLVFCFVWSINPEARQLLYELPILTVLGMTYLKSLGPLPRGFFFTFLGLSLFWSMAWFPINRAPFEGALTEFPWQYFMMHTGSYLSMQTYLLQLLPAVVGTAVLARWLRSLPRAQDA